VITPLGAALSQTHVTDSVFLLSAVKNAYELYSRSLGVGSHLLNGVLYKEYNANFEMWDIPILNQMIGSRARFIMTVTCMKVWLSLRLVSEKVVIEPSLCRH